MKLGYLSILIVSIGLVQASYHKRAPSERCTKLANAVEGVFNSFPNYVKCFIGKGTDHVLGFDVTDRETIERISCLLVDNANTGEDIFNALDNQGFIIQLLEVAYSAKSVIGTLGLTQVKREEINADLRECAPEGSIHVPRTFKNLDKAAYANLYTAVKDLQLFSLTPEMNKKILPVIGRVFGPFGPDIQVIDPPCTCSAITDPEERCNLASEAAAPFIEALKEDKRFLRFFADATGYIQQFTGVNLGSNFSSVALPYVCEVAKIQDVGDYRLFWEDLGLLEVGVELGIGFGCAGLQVTRIQNQRTVDRYEDENANWKPSEENVAMARAAIKLADVWLEVGLGSIDLQNVPPVPMAMIQQMCRAPKRFASTSLQSSRVQWQWTLDFAQDEELDYWVPSEVDIALARAMINLADVRMEVGLGSIDLQNVPPVPMAMIQRDCRRPENNTQNPSRYK